MRICTIAEDGKIRDTAKLLAQYLKRAQQSGETAERTAVQTFMRNPTIETWQEVVAISPLAQRLRIPSVQAIAAVYDMPNNLAAGTPLAAISMSAGDRTQLKKVLGPRGYLSTLANIGHMPKAKVRELLKNIVRSAPDVIDAARQLPGGNNTQTF